MIAPGRRSKFSSIKSRDHLVGDLGRAEGLEGDRQRAGHADRIRKLQLEAIGQPGGDDVLGDIARRIGRRAIDLCRILARERAAAVAGHAAVGIDDDLAPGQARVAHRPADHEAAGRD